MQLSDHCAVILAAGCSRRLAHLTKDKPKSLLQVNGRQILDYHLDAIRNYGIKEVIVVVGYLKEILKDYILNSCPDLKVSFIESDDYASTGHGWSLLQTRQAWSYINKPVVLIHADTYLNQKLYTDLAQFPEESVIPVDVNFQMKTFDEIVVKGSGGLISNLEKVSSGDSNVIGELIGIHKLSVSFISKFYDYSQNYINEYGKKENYEYILNKFLIDTQEQIHYMPVTSSWININYEEDLKYANSFT